MKTKKYLIVTALLILILGSAAPLAFAKPDNPNGKVMLKGTIDSISASSLMVKSAGSDWLINISPDTKFIQTGGISDFNIGDAIDVNGTINQANVWTIDASMIHKMVR